MKIDRKPLGRIELSHESRDGFWRYELTELSSGPARVGGRHEWHLDVRKTFHHFAFELGARLCQPCVMILSLFFRAGFEAIGAIGHSMSSNRSEEFLVQPVERGKIFWIAAA